MQYGLSSTTFDVTGPKVTEFSEITKSNGHYAVEGHSRSPIMIPIKSPCDFLLVINTNLLRIKHCFQVIVDYCTNLRFQEKGYLFTLVCDESQNSWLWNLTQETRNIALSYGAKGVLISGTV